MFKIKSFAVILSAVYSITTIAGESDLYDFLWLDPDKSVYVLQNKIYPKTKSIYLDFGYITGLTSAFQDTAGGQLKAGYFINEDWAVEWNYMQYSNVDNSTHDNVEYVSSTVPFVRRPISSNSVYAIWSPFYGKINTFNKIYYFDLSFGIGTGIYTMESNLKTANDPNTNTFETETYTPIQLKATTKFHVNKFMHVGVEFLSTNYNAKADPSNEKATKWKRNNDIIFSFGVSF